MFFDNTGDDIVIEMRALARLVSHDGGAPQYQNL